MRDKLLWTGVPAYAALFTLLGAIRYNAHRNFVDFGIFAQTAANAFGCFCNTIEGSHWAYHFSPMLYLVGAVVAVVHTPLTLIVLQALAGAFVIPPVYGIVARRTDRSIARLAALVVALYPALAGLIFNDFHENGFAPAAVAWTLWAFDGGWMVATLVCAAVALAIKEDQAVFLAIAGALGAWRFRGTTPGRIALAVAVVSASVAVSFFHQIQPRAELHAHWAPTRFYAWNLAEVRALVPAGLLARVGFIVLVFAPLVFLPFRSRWMWLAVAPFAEVLLSRMSTTYTMGSHYAGAWVGYVVVAFALAIRRMPAERARRALVMCAALCVLEFLVANPLHPGVNLRREQLRDMVLDAELATLPRNASIATQEEAFTHLALDDPNATLLPEDPNTETNATYILLDHDFPDSPRLQEYGDAVTHSKYRLIHRIGGIEVYRIPR